MKIRIWSYVVAAIAIFTASTGSAWAFDIPVYTLRIPALGRVDISLLSLLLLLLIVIAIVVVLPVAFGKGLAALLKDDQRKIAVGAVLLIIGAALVIYGIASINTVSSQVGAFLGDNDTTGMAAIGFGVFIGVVGFVTLLQRGSSSRKSETSTTRKCPFCAETIQAEAKLCRFCNRTLDASTTNQPG